MLAEWFTLGMMLASGPAASPPSGTARERPVLVTPPAVHFCSGEYADDVAALLPRSREFEQRQPAYTFCIRSSATYECPFYGADGALRRTRKQAIVHGTGFAYRRQEGGTLLVTNDHVVEWPAVTDADHRVENVPAGCRRVSDKLKIVDNESDEYEQDDTTLTRVVADPQMDIAVVKARVVLPVLPWRIGRSAGLRERNAVSVRGFPLGFFKADSVGKVIAAYDHDDFKEWDHDDFIIDALLSPGNSGSPVFAISCKTGEFELVGIYHAAYSQGSALNVVVAIDQARDLLTTLKRPARPRPPETQVSLDGQSRVRLTDMAKSTLETFFPFGAHPAIVRVRADGAFLFEVLSDDFPFRSQSLLILEDLPPVRADSFGALGRVWAGSRWGLKLYDRSELDGETQGQVLRMLDGLRRDALAAFAYRVAEATANGSKDRFEHVARLERSLRRNATSHRDLSQAADEVAERLGPDGPERAIARAEVLAALVRPSPAADVPATSAVVGIPRSKVMPSPTDGQSPADGGQP